MPKEAVNSQPAIRHQMNEFTSVNRKQAGVD